MGKSYVVRQGDCFTSISEQAGISAATLWNLPENAELKAKRKDMNVLFPGDVVFVPDLRARVADSPTDQEHSFVKNSETAMVRLRLTDDGEPRANVTYKMTIDGASFSGKTDGDGRIEHPLPTCAREGTLIVGDDTTQDVYQLNFGTLDPIDTDEGVKERLVNLGYGLDDLPAAIRAFQNRRGLPITGEIDDATRARLKDVFGQ